METRNTRAVVLEKEFDRWLIGSRTVKKNLRNAQRPCGSTDLAEDAFYAGANVERKRSNEQLQRIVTRIERVESKVPKSQSSGETSKLLHSLKKTMRKTIKTNSFVETPPVLFEEM